MGIIGSIIFHKFPSQVVIMNHQGLVQILLLLLLSRFSHVQFCLTPEMAEHQVPLSLGFSRQEHWSGLPFPSPLEKS